MAFKAPVGYAHSYSTINHAPYAKVAAPIAIAAPVYAKAAGPAYGLGYGGYGYGGLGYGSLGYGHGLGYGGAYGKAW